MIEIEKKSISVSEFKAHCTEELRKVETGKAELQITRHGKVIARVTPPLREDAGAIRDLIGSAAGMMIIADGAALDEPTWTPEQWGAFPDDKRKL